MAEANPTRRCLKCRREFHPGHRHLFVCNACKATRNWRNPISEYALAGGAGAVGIDPGVPEEEPLPAPRSPGPGGLRHADGASRRDFPIGDDAEPEDLRRKE